MPHTIIQLMFYACMLLCPAHLQAQDLAMNQG